MTEHTVRSYDVELDALRSSLLKMGQLSSQMLKDAMRSLVERDVPLAQQVIADDKTIDLQQRAAEEQTVLTIARRQPVADDLRTLVSVIRIASDIERIGDLAKNIAKRAIALAGQFQSPPGTMVGIEHMARSVLQQLTTVLKAFQDNDAEAALGVWHSDVEIDSLYNLIFRELLTYMMEDPRNITMCTHMLFCVKNIERIGDHTTNIAETMYYSVTGKSLDISRPKRESVEV